MSPDQERRLEEIFSAARELPPRERTTFLDSACGGDAELRYECALILSGAAYFADEPDRCAALFEPWSEVPPGREQETSRYCWRRRSSRPAYTRSSG